MEIIAHRGASFEAPENSLEALDLAIAQGATRLEIDVRGSKDDIPVVHHDANTERLGDKALLIEATTLDVLQEVKLPNGETIPSFEQLCKHIQGRAELNIEIKSANSRTLEQMLLHLEQYNLLDNALITSFETDDIALVKHLGYKGDTGLIVGSTSRNLRQRAYEAWPCPTWLESGASHLIMQHRLYHPLIGRFLRRHEGTLVLWMSMGDEEREPEKRASYYKRIALSQPNGVILARISEAIEQFELYQQEVEDILDLDEDENFDL